MQNYAVVCVKLRNGKPNSLVATREATTYVILFEMNMDYFFMCLLSHDARIIFSLINYMSKLPSRVLELKAAATSIIFDIFHSLLRMLPPLPNNISEPVKNT